MFENSAPSLSDIAAVTDGNRNGGWSDGNGWWVLIILFALFGWGGNGYGYGGNRGAAAAATTTDLQSGFDTQSILNKLNGINNGQCDGFYAMNTALLQGFNGQQMATMQSAYDTQTAINGLSSQLANCCCENRQGQADIKYAMATDTCAVTNAISMASRDITDNANANYRQLHDELVAMRMEDKDAQIADLTRQLGQKDLAASQCAQNAYLISQLHPSPIPAFNVPNPNATVGYGCYCNQA